MPGKQVTDLPKIQSSKLTDLLMVHDGYGLKSISIEDFNSCVSGNAGAHNSIYRGKYLGERVTDEQYSYISDGTFKDLFIGDYWTINGVNWRIAGFDYYLNSGDTNCATHHAVIVPDSCLYNANGQDSAGAWFDSEVELMCEQMVYGSGIFSPVSDGSVIPANYRVEKSQLPLFKHEPSRICNKDTWWIRDVINASNFVSIDNDGLSDSRYANISLGVRPTFCIF